MDNKNHIQELIALVLGTSAMLFAGLVDLNGFIQLVTLLLFLKFLEVIFTDLHNRKGNK